MSAQIECVAYVAVDVVVICELFAVTSLDYDLPPIVDRLH